MNPLPGHTWSTVYCWKCGESHEIPDPCGNRFCPVCSGPRRNHARAKMDAAIAAIRPKPGQRWRHVVLTIPNQRNPRSMADELTTSFRALRARPWWRNFVEGGFYVLEVTKRPSGWHVHLHILVLSRFIFGSTLSNEWKAVSSGSITKVSLAPPGRLSSYLTAYISKAELNDADGQDASKFLKNKRLFGAFGKLNIKGVKVTVPRFKCPKCGNDTWFHERSFHALEAKQLFGPAFYQSAASGAG